jgi:hypothetical protein
MATRETHPPASAAVQPTASLASKLAEIDGWESELPIVQKNAFMTFLGGSEVGFGDVAHLSSAFGAVPRRSGVPDGQQATK